MDYVSIRTKLQNKIFDKFSSTVTFINRVSPTYNTRGETEDVTTSTSSVQIVPYDVFAKRQTYEGFGTLNPGDMDAAVPYDTVVDVGTTFVFDSIGWEVKAIQKNYLSGQNIVTILRLAKTQA
jgi:hypothetical protein